MADKVVPGPVEGSAAVREAVCIHTRKIFDACRDKDCVEDLRVYPTVSSQTKLDSALSVRPRSAELLCADVRVKEITFNKGYYTVDVTYFYRVRGETFPGCEPVSGLAIFDKRVMLFGSQASVKMFASDGGGCAPCEEGLPVGVVESVSNVTRSCSSRHTTTACRTKRVRARARTIHARCLAVSTSPSTSSSRRTASRRTPTTAVCCKATGGRKIPSVCADGILKFVKK